MIAAAIGACEIAFWLLVLGGLAARYVLVRPRLGAILLMCVPLVDGLLLAVTAVHIADGARADWTHGLAAVYLGFSIIVGRRSSATSTGASPGASRVTCHRRCADRVAAASA